MTLAAACGWSLARSLAVALLAWPVCRVLTNWLLAQPPRSRRLAWWAVVIPFLCPELWSGYAWSGFAVRLAGTGVWDILPPTLFPTPRSIIVRDAAVDELLLDLLLLFRTIPVGTLALYFAPPSPLSREALYCGRLAGHTFRPDILVRSVASTALPAFVLVFLVAFQEFELASLIGRPAWTVWLFDAQVGGLALSESLKKTLLPVLCQFVVLIPLAWLIATSRSGPDVRRHPARRVTGPGKLIVWCSVVGGIAALLAAPAYLIGQGTISGLVRLARSPSQMRILEHEIAFGLAYAVAAALVAALVAGWLVRAASRSRWLVAGVCALALPGLVGSLALGLGLIYFLQQPLLRFAYKTPLSLAAGMILMLLPRAIVVRLLLSSSARPAGEHVARLLRKSAVAAVCGTAGDLAWHMRWRGEFWAVALLAWWAFFDLTTASLLAPVTIVSAPVMLYNQMHFGKNATLSALVLLTVLAPLLVFGAAAAARRPLFRWLWR